MPENWKPLHVREAGEAARAHHDELLEGVPPHLKPALRLWLDTYFLRHQFPGAVPPLHDIQVALRLEDFDWSRHGSAYQSFNEACAANPDLLLSAVDLVLRRMADGTIVGTERYQGPKALESLLGDAGSVWTIAPDKGSLVRRVTPGAARAVDGVVARGTRAGEHIAQAWHHAYGRNPNPSAAYREAVRAIEAAAVPVLTPKDSAATLGKIIGDLKANPTRFLTVFVAEVGRVVPVDVIRSLMELVWTNQFDRHGTADESTPIHVSLEQARAALHAAVTLVEWLQAGVISRAQ